MTTVIPLSQYAEYLKSLENGADNKGNFKFNDPLPDMKLPDMKLPTMDGWVSWAKEHKLNMMRPELMMLDEKDWIILRMLRTMARNTGMTSFFCTAEGMRVLQWAHRNYDYDNTITLAMAELEKEEK